MTCLPCIKKCLHVIAAIFPGIKGILITVGIIIIHELIKLSCKLVSSHRFLCLYRASISLFKLIKFFLYYIRQAPSELGIWQLMDKSSNSLSGRFVKYRENLSLKCLEC